MGFTGVITLLTTGMGPLCFQITITPKPELRGFGVDSLTKAPFGVTLTEVAISG